MNFSCLFFLTYFFLFLSFFCLLVSLGLSVFLFHVSVFLCIFPYFFFPFICMARFFPFSFYLCLSFSICPCLLFPLRLPVSLRLSCSLSVSFHLSVYLSFLSASLDLPVSSFPLFRTSVYPCLSVCTFFSVDLFLFPSPPPLCVSVSLYLLFIPASMWMSMCLFPPLHFGRLCLYLSLSLHACACICPLLSDFLFFSPPLYVSTVLFSSFYYFFLHPLYVFLSIHLYLVSNRFFHTVYILLLSLYLLLLTCLFLSFFFFI